MVKIVPFKSGHREAFRAINLAWLEEHGLLESHDLMILDHPQENIIEKGGFIWIAETETGEVVGSAGLMLQKTGVYELIKMTVTPAFQGRGIGRMLLETCIHTAREWKAKKIELFSNDRLQAAIRMYEQYGFRHVQVEGSPFETANVKMEMYL